MTTKFFDLLNSGTLLADGAMGTMLHARGVGFDRCFDELNLTNPAAVADAVVGRGADRERAVAQEHFDAHHVGPRLPAVAARVHRQRAADGAGDAGEELGLAAAVHRREALLELSDFVSIEPTPFAAAQRAEQPGFIGLAEEGPLREWSSADGLSPEDCEW